MRSPSVSLVLVFVLVVSMGGILFGCEGTPDTPDTGTANTPNANFQALTALTASDVQTIIAQAVAQAVASKVDATIAVLDRGGNVLGVFEMTRAIGKSTVIGSSSSPRCVQGVADPNICGLEGQPVPFTLAAISKAGTGAFLSSNGNAFSTRTAGDIIQEHRPVSVQGVLSGPLFGVQFSSLPCSDIKNNPPLPLGLAGDPGGMPLYKNGSLVGGIGVEEDGRYTVQRDPFDTSTPVEELIAIAGSRGFEAPSGIRSDQILLDGVRLPYTNADQSQTSSATMSFNEALGFGRIAPADPSFPIFLTGTIIGTPDPTFRFRMDNIAGRDVRIALNPDRTDRFQVRAGSGLTAQEVDRILTQGIETAYRLRAAIREPQASFVQVNVFVVDVDGSVLGYRGTPDAPFFGFDVAAQKARAAAFFSSRNAGNELRRAGSLVGSFADRAQLDGIALDGSIAFSNRGMGFLHRPFFPDGIDSTPPGPFSNALPEWSPFNVGLQLALVQGTLFNILANGVAAIPQDPVTGSRCTDRNITGLQNGTQIFAGSVPLYKNGQLVGGIGVSGDGIDQDDNVAFGAGTGFEPPLAIRCDQVVVQRGNDDGTRLPYVKLPRNPTDF
jgi:uncharacterized protein GlcG (DUF336 family)